jgi:transposase InsO family protein
MPWKEKSIMSQKEEFVELALRKKLPFSTLCKEFGISRTLGYKILKRYQAEGIQGLEVHSKAPHTHPNKTSKHVEESILKVRDDYPTWGSRKIKAYLIKKGIKNLPAISTINEIVKRYGYISEEESVKRKELIRFERPTPNDLWQMDFKGQFQLGNKQSCFPLTILDDHSRFSLCLKACVDEAFLPVKNQLIYTFKEYGLPNQINVDNGRPWGNSCLVRYTALTVWLMQLDIIVSHSRPRHPQTNGKNERFHRTLKEDVLNNKKMSTFVQVQKLFNKWRYIYNYERPHEGIGMQVPAQRYKPSPRCMPKKMPVIEYESKAILRKISKSHLQFKKRNYLVGKAFIGHYVELRPCEVNNTLDIYFGKHKIYTYDLE